MKYFDMDEFNCPCCNGNKMQSEFLRKLDLARENAGVPFHINSGYRCLRHNNDVGGKTTSSHRQGCAGDIRAVSLSERFAILRGLILAGFRRIGIGKTFIHADDDPEKDQDIIWTY